MHPEKHHVVFRGCGFRCRQGSRWSRDGLFAGWPLSLVGAGGPVKQRVRCAWGAFVIGGSLKGGLGDENSWNRTSLPVRGLISAQGVSFWGVAERFGRFYVRGAWPAPRGVRSVVSAARYWGFPGPQYL